MLAGEIERFDTVTRADGVVAVGLQQIVKELHIELVVLHDEDGLGHPKPSCVLTPGVPGDARYDCPIDAPAEPHSR